MKIGFDHEKYLKIQSERIKERIVVSFIASIPIFNKKQL